MSSAATVYAATLSDTQNLLGVREVVTFFTGGGSPGKFCAVAPAQVITAHRITHTNPQRLFMPYPKEGLFSCRQERGLEVHTRERHCCLKQDGIRSQEQASCHSSSFRRDESTPGRNSQNCFGIAVWLRKKGWRIGPVLNK